MMNAIQASEQLIELIHRNEDIANYADGCDAETMAAAEDALGIPFPPSYRYLIEEFGTWDIVTKNSSGFTQRPLWGRRCWVPSRKPWMLATSTECHPI